jgi:hypothetical protein
MRESYTTTSATPDDADSPREVSVAQVSSQVFDLRAERQNNYSKFAASVIQSPEHFCVIERLTYPTIKRHKLYTNYSHVAAAVNGSCKLLDLNVNGNCVNRHSARLASKSMVSNSFVQLFAEF